MAKLKRYAKAYNIDVGGVIEKDDFIERLIAARVRAFSSGMGLPIRHTLPQLSPLLGRRTNVDL